jgi:hypothetical protein
VPQAPRVRRTVSTLARGVFFFSLVRVGDGPVVTVKPTFAPSHQFPSFWPRRLVNRHIPTAARALTTSD